MPPLRELAPQPIVWASSTATFAPRLVSARAAARPVKPPPITATSTVSGNAPEASPAGIDVVSIQNDLSLSDANTVG